MKKKAKGVVLLEAFLALMLMTMASYGLAAVNSVQFSQLIASADANQAKNYAEMEAQYLKQLGYDDVVDENYDEDEPSRTPRYPNGKNSTDDKASNARDMTKFLGATEGAKWRSTATLGETISNIGGDVDNKIQNVIVSVYKASDGADASPRATVTVPLSTQAGNGLTPVGGIIVWPKDSDPSTSSNIWLECNGQTYDTSRFKKLYKVLGSNRVPNYQGMFLRGAGSQSYSQVNGDFFRVDNKEHTSYLGYNIATSTNHKSGSIGNIQGDSMRELNWSTFTAFSHTDDKTSYGELYGYDTYGLPIWLKNINGYSGHASTQANPSTDEGYVYLPLAPISIHVTETTSSGSGEHASTTTTSYDAEIPTKEINMFLTMDSWRASWSTPVDNEIRPVNVAVKYYIRAK